MLVIIVIFFMSTAISPGSAGADFAVEVSPYVDQKPVVAHNTQSGESMVAYLTEADTGGGPHPEVRIRRLNSNGQVLGNAINPYAQNSPHYAIGRPAIAYSPNSNRYLVVFPGVWFGIYYYWVRFLDGNGNLLDALYMFDEQSSEYSYYDRDDEGTVQVTHNSLLDEFLITVQRRHIQTGNGGIWGQRVSEANGLIGSAVQLADFGIGGIGPHAIAYAPVAGTDPAGGRYLFVFLTWLGPELLKSDLTPIYTFYRFIPGQGFEPYGTHIPVNWGEPDGDSEVKDIAYGEVEGRKRFLLVYWDKDNQCPPGTGDWCTEWTGVWGAYIDPERTFYTTDVNTPFPISKIDAHRDVDPKARVAYSNAGAFYVVWYESTEDPPFSHIRGVWVDYFVEDSGSVSVPRPYDNVVISDVSGGGCLTVWPFSCQSDQDPDLPDVAALGESSAVVVWHQRYPPDPVNLNIKGDIFTGTLVQEESADELMMDIGSFGLWHLQGTTWTPIAWAVDVDDLERWNSLVIDFGNQGPSGLWHYDLAGWIPITMEDVEGMEAWADGLAIDRGASGLWNIDDQFNWSVIAYGLNVDGMARWGNGLAVDLGAAGLFYYPGWSLIAGEDVDGCAEWSGGLAIDRGLLGLWNVDGGNWQKLDSGNPETMTKWGDGLVADFGAGGLHYYNGSSWTLIAGTDVDGVEAWADGLIIDIGAAGLWNFDWTSGWTPIANLNVDGCEPVDLY